MYKELVDKVKEIKGSDPFLVTITVYDDKNEDKLETYVFSNEFPYEEFDGTKKMIGKLIDEHRNKGK